MKGLLLKLAKGFTFLGLCATLLAGLFLVGLGLWNIFVPNDKFDTEFTIEVPITYESDFDVKDIILKDDLFAVDRIEFKNVVLEMAPNNNKAMIKFITIAGVLIYVLMIFFIFYHLYNILVNIDQNPFIPANIQRIQKIGFIVLGIALYEFLLRIIARLFIASRIDHPDLNGFEISLSTGRLQTVFFGILILIIAEAFRKGQVLQEYENQTV